MSADAMDVRPTRRARQTNCSQAIGRFVALVSFLGCIGTAAGQPVQEPGDQAARNNAGGPLQLRDTLWQDLPDEVRSVTIGPDERLWLELRTQLPPSDVDAAKAAIAREFANATPRLAGVRPVLFEPNRRIWFRLARGDTLLGYDGQVWVENTLPQGRRFTGSCPGQGCLDGGGSNLVVDGHLFFPESYGVHVFDGTNWSFQQMATAPSPQHLRLLLLPDMDGEGVLAYGDRPVQRLWHWNDGQWTHIDSNLPDVTSACPAPNRSIWLFRGNGNAVTIPLNAAVGPAERVRPLIERLRAAATPAERQAAVAAITECGADVAGVVEEALATSYDPEFLAALIAAVRTLRQGANARIGDATVHSATLLAYDVQRRRAILRANGVHRGDTPAGDGLLIAAATGPVAFHPMPQAAWRSFPIDVGSTCFSADGTAAWINGAPGHQPVRCLDIESGTVRTTIPDRRFTRVAAIRGDGTVFLASDRGAHPEAVIRVFRPGKPDDRRRLPIEATRLASHGPGVLGCDSLGGVWAVLADRGLARLSRGEWTAVDASGGPPADGIVSMLAGSRGDVLLFGSRFAYWRDGKTSWSGALRDLIAEHRDAIAASFSTSRQPCHGEAAYHVAADGSGNIWLRDGLRHGLAVLVDREWIVAGSALQDAGARVPTVQYLAAAGGDFVYVSDLMLVHDRGRSFFGSIRDGRPTFGEAPHTSHLSRSRMQIRDAEGGLWLPTNVQGSNGTSDWVSDQLALRIVDGKVVTTLKNAGWPALCDATGGVWLDLVPKVPADTVSIWRDGAVAATLRVPGFMPSPTEPSQLYAGPPGSVYAWTTRGLTHLVAPPDRPAAYRVDATYDIACDDGTFVPLSCTTEGILVGRAFLDDGGTSVAIVQLPGPERGDNHETK